MSTTTERFKGAAEEVGGKIKEGVASALGNDRLESEGKTDQAQGKVRQAGANLIDNAKDAASKVAGKVADKVSDLADKINPKH